MSTLEYHDMLQLLHDCREDIIEAEHRGLPTMLEGQAAFGRAKQMLDHNILDERSSGSIVLTKHFLEKKNSVAKDLPFEDFDRCQTEKLAIALIAPQ